VSPAEPRTGTHEVPTLGRRDVAGELNLLHAGARRSRHTALFGQADRDLQGNATVEARVEGKPTKFRLVEASSELGLRRALSFAEPGEPLVLLVTYGLDVPNDVAARLAKGQVLQIERSRRLAARFDARTVNPEVLAEQPLVDALLDEGGEFGSIAGLSVDLDTAWRALMRRLTGSSTLDFASEEQVVAFAATVSGGPDQVRRMSRWPELRERLHAWIERKAGKVARLAWRAWERDEGPQVAALAFVLDAVSGDLAANGFLRGRLATVLEQVDPELRGAENDGALLGAWGAVAPRLYFQLEATGALAPVLAAADRILPTGPDVDPALEKSRFVPRGFALTQEALAKALRAALDRPGDRAALEAAIDASRRLEEHRLAQADANRAVVERARMAVRLVAWRELSGRDVLAKVIETPVPDRAAALATWYASEGAYVDHARRSGRGGSSDPLGGTIAAVLTAVGLLRDQYDQAFADSLPAWLGRSRPVGAVPIEEGLNRFAVPFLKESPSRKLLVLLLDGMAWANACELLLDLEGHGFAPTKNQLSRDGLRLLEPMLAALPTITDVSRSAFFAGRLPRSGETLSTAGDPDRFASHKGLVDALGGRSPRLLLSADVDDPSGGASRKALDLVGSDDRVVGIVLNAIDDGLRAGPQTRQRVGVDDIRPLRDLLQASRAAGRAILIVSDHGHVPGARLETLSVPQASASRWRALSEGEAPRARELALTGDKVWRPRGKERVALLWAETDSYSSSAREGEHGGASLAEVVAPALFVAHESLASDMRRAVADAPGIDGLEVTAYPKPRFWSLDLPRLATPAPVPRRPREGKTPEGQVAMPFLPPTPAVPPPVAQPAAAPAEVAMLAASKVFKAMLERRPKAKRELVLRAVAALFEGEGQLAPDIFAARTGTLPTRVTGAVASIQEVLNVDGLPVLVYDPLEKLVKLDRDTFRAVFKDA